MDEYRWPQPAGVDAVNRLLRLPVHGQEQDWEIELADGGRLIEFLDAFETAELDIEGRSALTLLILFSITYAETQVAQADLQRAGSAIHGDPEILRRMRSYWSDGFQDNEEAVKGLLAEPPR